MTPRLFRIIETHARIDDALRREQRRDGSRSRIRELRLLKLRAKQLIHQLLSRPATA